MFEKINAKGRKGEKREADQRNYDIIILQREAHKENLKTSSFLLSRDSQKNLITFAHLHKLWVQ